VVAIPGVLQTCGYEIYRMEEAEELDDEMVEQLAREVHRDYVVKRTKEGQTLATNPSLNDYDQLSSHLKESNRDRAAAIPRQLRAIGWGLRRPPIGMQPALLELSADELEKMAKLEHARWNWHHWLSGWIQKDGKRDEENKTHPYLVFWDRLPEEIKNYDRQSAGLVPVLVQRAGYEARKVG
jgi:hypothetical protein